ncbi:MAG: methyltransferase domain-containing protein [Bacteroidota bacterium]
MKSPLFQRKGIPFFSDKTDKDFQKDPYERYDPMVIRQSALHLADQLWGQYPMQSILDFAHNYYPKERSVQLLEVGSGLGRWIATLAQAYPQAECWGIDYSYQMLKQAQEFWVQGKSISIDLSNKGLPQVGHLKGHQLDNLNFGLAKATDLPFDDHSQDLVLSSFLLDRLEEPHDGLLEMYRVLKSGGKLILITPLNFDRAAHWEQLYPPTKVKHLLEQIGFGILDWQEKWMIEEPLDARGNLVVWNCLGLVGSK